MLRKTNSLIHLFWLLLLLSAKTRICKQILSLSQRLRSWFCHRSIGMHRSISINRSSKDMCNSIWLIKLRRLDDQDCRAKLLRLMEVVKLFSMACLLTHNIFGSIPCMGVLPSVRRWFPNTWQECKLIKISLWHGLKIETSQTQCKITMMKRIMQRPAQICLQRNKAVWGS